MKTDLSIIIVNWNTRDLLAQCLRSLSVQATAGSGPQALLRADDVPCEVWVVDNASADGSAQMVRERFPWVSLIENCENAGFARANNQAIRESTGRYVLLLNSDAEVPPGALSSMVQFMEKHTQVGAVGPKLVNPDGSFQASFAHFPTLVSEFLLMTGLARLVIGQYAPSPGPRPGETARPVDWVAGAALLVRRAAIDNTGPLDERYFLYSEETNWCWRLRQAGWQVWYLPDVTVTHIAGASSRQRSVVSYGLLYANKVRFFEDAYGSKAARGLRTMFTVLACFRLCVWALFSIVRLPVDGGRSMRSRLRQELVLLRDGFGLVR